MLQQRGTLGQQNLLETPRGSIERLRLVDEQRNRQRLQFRVQLRPILRANIEALIGMNVLRECLLTLNAPGNQFILGS
jgi:hypothetical protein